LIFALASAARRDIERLRERPALVDVGAQHAVTDQAAK